jgi:hypothetical protein
MVTKRTEGIHQDTMLVLVMDWANCGKSRNPSPRTANNPVKAIPVALLLTSRGCVQDCECTRLCVYKTVCVQDCSVQDCVYKTMCTRL